MLAASLAPRMRSVTFSPLHRTLRIAAGFGPGIVIQIHGRCTSFMDFMVFREQKECPLRGCLVQYAAGPCYSCRGGILSSLQHVSCGHWLFAGGCLRGRLRPHAPGRGMIPLHPTVLVIVDSPRSELFPNEAVRKNQVSTIRSCSPETGEQRKPFTKKPPRE